MEDFKQKIADLNNWQEENKDTRAIIVIALEEKDDNNHSLQAVISGKSVNLTQAVYSAMRSDKQFRRFVQTALSEYNRKTFEPLIDKLIQELTGDEDETNEDSLDVKQEGEKQ